MTYWEMVVMIMKSLCSFVLVFGIAGITTAFIMWVLPDSIKDRIMGEDEDWLD